MNLQSSFTYDNFGRRTSRTLQQDNTTVSTAGRSYDTFGRIASVSNGTDTLSYTYVPGTNMIGSATWQNASINTVNTYDQYKRLTNIAVNGENVYGYTLNDKNQRTSATLPDGNKWNYTYDVMGQLTGAVKQDTANNPLANMNYFYDLIGNRTSATENSATTTYASNLVNQYTAVNAVVPVYDLDGNMTSYNGWNYTYNGENRLIVAENVATGVRVEADYDYMGRRIFKKVYNNNTLVKHSIFVYDEFKQIAEFDVLNNNLLKASYLWQPIGLDVVLLRNSEYLIADGNKNIIQVRNATGSVTDSYIYDPFGKVTHNGSSENPFQFSSEFFDNETGLVYYNYRYYMPLLGRWINRDPIEEDGGASLYSFVYNAATSMFDNRGLELYAIDGSGLDESAMSNVYKFRQRYLDGKSYYYRGVGNPTVKFSIFGKFWGAGAAKIVEDCYNNVCENYCKGKKKIDIIGFSRGAAIANEIAHELKNNGCCCSHYYRLNPWTLGVTIKKEKIKSYPEVRFLGLFDTVHSFPYAVAWAWKDNYIANNVKNSSHAISLDENRSFFRNSNLQSPTNGNHYVKYFPGVHSDIGGTMSFVIGNYTLRWMIDKAIEAGVKMNTSNLKTLDWFEKQMIRQPMMFQPFLNSGLSNIFQD